MGMGIGINVQTPDFGPVKGHQEDIACGVWFTSQGHTMPKLIKYQDEEGMMHIIDNIHVQYASKKNFCGIPSIEYRCTTSDGDRQYAFRLIFYIEKCQWKMIMEKT